jgi:hypothetical protein
LTSSMSSSLVLNRSLASQTFMFVKEQSKQWMHTHSPNKPKKFKQTLSNRKMMAAVFSHCKGIFLTEFMAPDTTITSEVYCETLNKLRSSIQNKRPRASFSCTTTRGHTLRLAPRLYTSSSTGRFSSTPLTARTWHQAITISSQR